jgi:hypothetical protein
LYFLPQNPPQNFSIICELENDYNYFLYIM